MSALPFAAFRPGSIDYTPHQETMRRLLRAMEERKVCKIHYQSISENKPKTYFIKPLKLFSIMTPFTFTPGSPKRPVRNTRNLIMIPCWPFTGSRRWK